MKPLRPKFAVSTLLILTAIAAIVIAVSTYPARQVAKTKATYDAQKQAVKTATEAYIAQLSSAGYSVVDDSTGLGGSGEWRMYVAIAASSSDGRQDVCYVEIMGFVSHNDKDQPTWMEVLPMKISHRGRTLNDAFLALLIGKLKERGWTYTVDDRCRGDGWFTTNKSAFYLATDLARTKRCTSAAK